MKHFVVALMALVGAFIVQAPVAHAHSAGEAFDDLRGYGYTKLRLKNEYHDRNGRPIFKFKACRNGRIYWIKINWYGNILHKRKGGLCAFRIN